MYTLTLSKPERNAFDWVGDRYSTRAIADMLSDTLPAFDLWDEPGDITFAIPEHIAWDIREEAEQEDSMWPCFAPALASKMQAFCDSIV